jgi:MFS family permease
MAGVAYLFVFLGILAAVVQGGLVGRLARRYGERRLVVAGALLLLPAYAALTRVATLPRLAVLLAFLALGAGLTGPSLSSLISRISAEDEQGGILGLYQSMASLARILGPFWGVFAFERFGPEAPYWTAAGAGTVVLILALRLTGQGTEEGTAVNRPG